MPRQFGAPHKFGSEPSEDITRRISSGEQMTGRQRKLLANRIAGRSEPSEQATGDGKRTEALPGRSAINRAGSAMCRTVGERRRRRVSSLPLLRRIDSFTS